MQQHGQSPRKRKLVLYFTYGLMTATVALISTICILLVLGYRFDLKNGDVEQGSLLQFRSFPAGATITLDQEVMSFVTPGKKNVAVGKHNVNMRLDGYHQWQKDFTVKPSELRWLNYARMIPTNLRTSVVKEFPSVVDELPSPDKKWMLMLQHADRAEFTLVDLRDQDKPVFSELRLPAGSYTTREGQKHAFRLVEWDFGARYILVKHVIGDTTEYLRIDRTDVANTVNISTKLGVAPDDIHFSGTSGTVYYALEKGLLRKLDSGAGTISEPIVRDVASFRIYKTNTLGYVKMAVENKIGVGIVVNNNAKRVATYDSTLPVLIDLNEYFNDYYFAVARGNSVEVFKDPESDNNRRKIATHVSPSAIAWLRFGNSGRFVVSGNGSQFMTYDIETDEKFDVNLPGTALEATKPLQWLDDYYMVSAADNDLRLTEFDGGNQHVIASALPGYAVTLNENGRLLYSLTKTQSGTTALQVTKMTTND